MNEPQRREKNSLAFLDYVAGMAGYKLRPVNYWTLEVMGPAMLDLAIARGNKEFLKLSKGRMNDEVNVYFFIQTAAPRQVSRAVRGYRRDLEEGKPAAEAWETLMSEHVDPFLIQLSPEDKAELAEQLGQFDEIAAAQVSSAPPKDHKPERPDPKSGSQAG